MKYSVPEMTIICQVIGSQRLAGFDVFPVLSKEESELALKKLTEKDIIKDERLTEHGLAVTQSIYLYIHARKFIKIGNGIFANYQDDEYVIISLNDGEYNVELINQDQIVVSILGQFKGWKDVKDGDYKEKFLSRQTFYELMTDNSDIEAMYYYKIDLDREEDRNAVMFIHDNYLQHYDSNKEELCFYPLDSVQRGIEEIFQWER